MYNLYNTLEVRKIKGGKRNEKQTTTRSSSFLSISMLGSRYRSFVKTSRAIIFNRIILVVLSVEAATGKNVKKHGNGKKVSVMILEKTGSAESRSRKTRIEESIT
jgi:hypothetical protein